MSAILPIVEGDGDLTAVPELLRRVLHESLHIFDVAVLRPHKRGEWPKVKQEFSRYYQVARLEQVPILIVSDFDCDECVDHESERAWAIEEAARIDPEGRLEVAFMVKEFESLFLAEQECVRHAFPELVEGASFPKDPESVRDAKGWISCSLPKGRAYKPTIDQARLTARLNLTTLMGASPSFQRFRQSIERLLAP